MESGPDPVRGLPHRILVDRFGAKHSGPEPAAAFTDLSRDDRLAGSGAGRELFFAVRGARHDSHTSLARLADRVDGVVAEQPPAPGFPIPHYRVKNSRKSFALAHQFLAGDPARALRLFGITGTNGKSTAVRILAAILRAAGRQVGWMGTVDARIGRRERPSRLTTPEPDELARALAHHRARGGEDLVLEVSSHALDQDRVAGLVFSGALMTHLGRDHYDYHGGPAQYLAAKLRLFRALAAEAPAVLPHGLALPRTGEWLTNARVLRFGEADSSADERPEAHPISVELDAEGIRGQIQVLDATLELHMVLVGRHNLRNAMGAALLARAIGVSGTAIEEGLAAVRPVRGRLQCLATDPIRVYLDYAHTPDALEAVLRSLRECDVDRISVVFGCGGERDRGKRPEMGAVSERFADTLYITSDNPRAEDPRDILREIVRGMRDPRRAWLGVDRAQAIRTAILDCHEGGTVLVAGKGHEREQEVCGRRIPFDDAVEIEKALRERGGGA